MRPIERQINFHPKYRALWNPECPVRYYIVTGGRGSGKSFGIACKAGTDIIRPIRKNLLYLRQTLVSAHVSIIPEFAEKLSLMGYDRFIQQGKTDIKNLITGSMIYFRGIQTGTKSNEAKLKSIANIGNAIIDEAQELVDEPTFDRIDLSLRDKEVPNQVILSLNPTNKTHWIYQRFFKNRNIPDDFNGYHGDTCYIHTSYLDNLENLSDDFIRLAETCKTENPSKYRNIFLGHWSGNNENALWNESMIEPYRANAAPPDLDRIIVAVDPAVTNTKKSDETGIVVAGMKRQRGTMQYYVLADRSLRGSPNTWGSAVVNAYKEFRADRVVAETNNGGDLVEAVLRGIDKSISFRSVHASRGKIARAEPVAALYEQKNVHHVGRFGILEDQMCNYCGYDEEASPDRLDALVWGLTDLSRGFGSGAIEA